MEDNIYDMMERMIGEFKAFIKKGDAPEDELKLADILMNELTDYLAYNEGI